jgi:hypothetical protein
MKKASDTARRDSVQALVSRFSQQIAAEKELKGDDWDRKDIRRCLKGLALARSVTYGDKIRSGAKVRRIVEGSTAVRACELPGKDSGMFQDAAAQNNLPQLTHFELPFCSLAQARLFFAS